MGQFAGKGLMLRSNRAEQAPPRLSLQLFFQLIEEAPVGALGDELLRGRLDEPDFMQAQS